MSLSGCVGAKAEAVTCRVWVTCCAAPTNVLVALWHSAEMRGTHAALQ